MPALTSYPSNPDDVEDAAEDERRRRQDYTGAAWKYYRGEHKKPLAVRQGEPDDNIILNLTRKLVDSGASMLFGSGITFELQENATTPAEEWLREMWRQNRRKILLHDVALNGYVTGHPVVKLVPAADEAASSYPRIINIDPSVLTAFWRPDDVEQVLFYTLKWSDTMRQDIVWDEGAGAWFILEYEKNVRSQSQKWSLVDEMRWEWAWPPILDWKNLPNPNKYYGLSDLDHADLNDAVNFVASNTNRILKHHAHPKTIGIGMKASDVQMTSIDGFMAVPNPDAEIFNLEMMSDLKSSQEFLDFLRTMFFWLGSGVDISALRDRIGQITNFGLRVIFKDAIDRLELKQALYGEALTEINRRTLEMAGFGPDSVTKVHWGEPLPIDELTETQAKQTQIDMGTTSRQTAAIELGRDWDVERERMEEEAASERNIGGELLRAFSRGQ